MAKLTCFVYPKGVGLDQWEITRKVFVMVEHVQRRPEML